jgi:hypothetical protein
MPTLRVGLIIGEKHVFDLRLPPGFDVPVSVQDPVDGPLGTSTRLPLLRYEEDAWHLYARPTSQVQVAFAIAGGEPEVVRGGEAVTARGRAVNGGWFRMRLLQGDRGKVEIPGPMPWHIIFHVLNETQDAFLVLTAWDSNSVDSPDNPNAHIP